MNGILQALPCLETYSRTLLKSAEPTDSDSVPHCPNWAKWTYRKFMGSLMSSLVIFLLLPFLLLPELDWLFLPSLLFPLRRKKSKEERLARGFE